MTLRFQKFLCVGLLLAQSAVAQDNALCEDEEENLETRVAACQGLLDRAAPIERAEALADLADVYYENDDWSAAVNFYSQVIDLNPEHSRAVARRGVAFEELGRWAEAEADFNRRIEIDPDGTWGYFLLGRRLATSMRHEAAIPILLQAVELDPEYHWAWDMLGFAYSRGRHFAEAAEAYRQLTRIRPFSDNAHLHAHWRYEQAGQLQESAYHGRIAHTLNPNDLPTRDWLIEYLGDAPPADLAPHLWSLPSEDQVLRYFLVRAPVDTRDEMTRAIEDMINFFGGNTYPFPNSGAVVQMPAIAFGDNATVTTPFIEESSGLELPPPSGAPRLYGIMPFFIRPFGPNGPLVYPSFDIGDPDGIWPLEAGNSAEGEGRFLVDCTAGIGMSYAALGCRPGTETAETGQFSFRLDVSLDRIHVPMGIFDTYKIDMTVDSSVSIFGQPLETVFTAGFWMEPELNTYVARIFTANDEYMFFQAMEEVRTD